MKQLVSKKLADMAAMEIAKYIVEHEISPGNKLPSENFFSKYFGISRPSVREGMSRLMSVGLIHSVQGYGVVLNDISVNAYFSTMENSILNSFISLTPKDVKEIIETRTFLEQYACKCFLATGTDEEIVPLEKIVEDLWKVIENPKEFRTLDLEFHLKLINLSHNSILCHFYRLMRAPAEREIEVLMQHEDLKKVQLWHVRILEALQSHDEIVLQHIQDHLYYTFPVYISKH